MSYVIQLLPIYDYEYKIKFIQSYWFRYDRRNCGRHCRKIQPDMMSADHIFLYQWIDHRYVISIICREILCFEYHKTKVGSRMTNL